MSAVEVDALLTARAHPLGGTVAQIRALLREVPGAVESVKWNAPNYALADDFATMQLRRDDAVQLVLHTGAKPKPDHPEIVLDTVPRVAKRAARNRLVLTYREAQLSPADADALAALVRSWVQQLAE
jgi:hypothetical protein